VSPGKEWRSVLSISTVVKACLLESGRLDRPKQQPRLEGFRSKAAGCSLVYLRGEKGGHARSLITAMRSRRMTAGVDNELEMCTLVIIPILLLNTVSTLQSRATMIRTFDERPLYSSSVLFSPTSEYDIR
jgi:hypothetical protein